MGRLLIVEDNLIIRKVMIGALEREGHVVLGASSGAEALELLQDHEIDLVLLDVLLPGRDGLEILQEIRSTWTAIELPVIMVTAKLGSPNVVEAMRLGANDYVTKPVDFAVLHARLAAHLEIKRLTDLREDFLRIAAHDLKKPLAVMVDIAETLLEDCRVGEPINKDLPVFLSHFAKSGEQMNRLIADFLDLDAVSGGGFVLDMQRIELPPIAERVAAANRSYIESKGGGELVLHVDPELPTMCGDPARVEQVLDNLIGNAIKFGPLGATIRVELRDEGETVLLEVVDQGPGLTSQDFQDLFRRYARMSAEPTGGEASSGLGLAISRRIVRLHGGEIGARNNAERGATFWVRWPAQRASSDASPETAAASSAA